MTLRAPSFADATDRQLLPIETLAPAPNSASAQPVGSGAASRVANRYHSSGSESVSNERLVVLLFERLLKDVDDGLVAIAAKAPDVAHGHLIHAQEIVEALQRALDTEAWPEGKQLIALYEYVNDLLVRANVTKDATVLRTCRSCIEPLVGAWQAAWAETAGQRR